MKISEHRFTFENLFSHQKCHLKNHELIITTKINIYYLIPLCFFSKTDNGRRELWIDPRLLLKKDYLENKRFGRVHFSVFRKYKKTEFNPAANNITRIRPKT